MFEQRYRQHAGPHVDIIRLAAHTEVQCSWKVGLRNVSLSYCYCGTNMHKMNIAKATMQTTMHIHIPDASSPKS